MTSVEIEGFVEDKHPFVLCHYICPRLKLARVIKFLIDTGCTITTILGGDAKELAIDCEGLRRSKISTQVPDGKHKPYILPRSVLVFETKKGKKTNFTLNVLTRSRSLNRRGVALNQIIVYWG